MPGLYVGKGWEEGREKLRRVVGRVLVSPWVREFGISIRRIRGEPDLTELLLQNLQYLRSQQTESKAMVGNYFVRGQFPIGGDQVIPAVG
jgi:hypothetical protein